MAQSHMSKNKEQQHNLKMCLMEAGQSQDNCNPIYEGLTTEKKCSMRDTELYKLMKLLMKYMEMTALFHEWPSYGQDEVSYGSGWEKAIGHCKYIIRCFWNVYPLTLVLVYGATMIFVVFSHYKLSFEMELIGLSVEIISGSFFIENALGVLYMYYVCQSGKCLQLLQQYSLLTMSKLDKQRLDKVVVRTSKIAFIILSFYLVIVMGTLYFNKSTAGISVPWLLDINIVDL